jgi:hypothetical protein
MVPDDDAWLMKQIKKDSYQNDKSLTKIQG